MAWSKPLKVHIRTDRGHVMSRRLVPVDPGADLNYLGPGERVEMREETDVELRARIESTFNYWTGACGTWAYANMRVDRSVFEQIPEGAQCRRCRVLEKITKAADEERALSVEAMLIGLSRVWEPEIEPQKGLARIEWLVEKYE